MTSGENGLSKPTAGLREVDGKPDSQRGTELPPYHPFRSEEAKKRYLDLYDMRAKEWPVASDVKMVDTSWGRTFVRSSGPKEAPPLVLLPGATATSLMWIPNIRGLSEGYRTYAVDNIYDFGRSVYARPIRTPDDFVSWLDELFSAIELEGGINLVGMSYGGWLAALYAIRFPERLNKTVLLAPAGTVLGFRLAFNLRIFLVLLPCRRTVRRFIYWMFEGLTRKGELEKAALENVVDDMLTGLRCFKPKRFIRPTVLKDAELRRIGKPLLYMVGENEKIYSARKAVRRLNRISPWIRTEIVPGADHAFTVAEADIVNEKILDFLGQE